MAEYNFKEQKEEFSAKHGKKLPVWISPNYEVAKAKAIEIIESKKYGVTEADFWILMNATKSEKMAYTGLIISHNGCLKINDNLESKFNPGCVHLDKDGYRGSLVYTYCNEEQGIYEVGEVSQTNCKNDYPYAMAFKRLFDRVVLKLSKLAYNGIYSDSESEEFSQQLNPDENDKPKDEQPKKQETPAKSQIQELPRIKLIRLLSDRGIDSRQYAAEKGINKETPESVILECIKELEAM